VWVRSQIIWIPLEVSWEVSVVLPEPKRLAAFGSGQEEAEDAI
jgi:hypothetical protein